MIKVAASFIFLIAVASTTMLAQGKDLVITGSVSEVKISGIGNYVLVDPKNEWGGRHYERSQTWFGMALRLTYCNRGDVNVIVPLPLAFPNQMTKLLFLDIPSSSGSPVKTVVGKVSPQYGRSTFDEKSVDDLKSSTPPHNFKIIEPDTCYEYVGSLAIESGFKVDVIKREINKHDVEYARPEYPYFRLQYGFAMKDTLPVAEAKARWSKFGKLVTSSDGDFFFETDVILNKLPD
ncbi:MAG: hypothetical protein ABL999_03160 [Pyrinomonadaceae bacterium]